MFPPAARPLVPTERFVQLAAEAGIVFEPGEVERLGQYLGLLLAASAMVNLTAVRDPAEAWEKLIFDALTLLPLLAELPDGARVIDVGSGGGLPGVPLAIVLPHLRFTLLDATGKKAAFLRHAAAELGLANVSVVHDRAETYGQSNGPGGAGAGRAAFDAVLARAVGKVAMLAELTVPLAAVGGQVLLTKGERAEEELAEARKALHALCVSVGGVIQTPTGRIVVLDKSRPTPGKYPRASGEPKRKPLG
ncbi:MAG: 16S rRNA (guanine(527)-N(7))-methyltransferase RsmG [Phycisphaeraceae bacterium]|nr:16S rRNA (guanine(527)-N(7))-methyltransferase RsmG [Phycisphaeraceae bacterium]MCW5763218.1 16S rRNA (guanine(527)-N(7))-methyltransferase RsmG [Phycisphaeraceae bacterium]